ncbi:MAG: hypothetical protein IPN24_10635 [Betaproteobacteria bacterium]|nr:hypothetical protein [Betaproteobacteria bacterium]
MSPRGPKEKIIAIAVVNGGDTSGSSTLASIAPSIHGGRRPRAAVNANTKPSTVPTSPTSVPSSRLFQKARIWWRSVSTAASPASEKWPWSVSTRASSIASG